MRFPLSYSYDGPKRIGWSYDPNGNVTSDATNGVSIDWNVIDLPRAITSGTSSTQRFYLADGTLSHIQDGTQMRIFLGDIVFKISSGSFGIESAGWEGGRLLPGTGNDKVLYYVNDHLGSVRVIKNGNGSIKQRFDYHPYGSVSRSWSSAATDTPEKRYRFGGKEIAGTASNATATGSDTYLDFGARLYNPRTALWMSQDPMAESYYPFSPYLYCAGSPGNVVDPTGLTYYIVNNEIHDIIDGFLDTINITEEEFAKVSKLSTKSEKRYLKYRLKLMDKYGYTDSEGNDVLAASNVSATYASASYMDAIAGVMAVDVSILDPTDAAWLKWGVYAMVGVSYYYDKMAKEISSIKRRKAGPEGVQYVLTATESGWYPSSCFGGGLVYLNTGDVGKYGETIHSDTRYSKKWRSLYKLDKKDEYVGSQRNCKIMEKIKIYNYFYTYGHLPPGNKVFR